MDYHLASLPLSTDLWRQIVSKIYAYGSPRPMNFSAWSIEKSSSSSAGQHCCHYYNLQNSLFHLREMSKKSYWKMEMHTFSTYMFLIVFSYFSHDKDVNNIFSWEGFAFSNKCPCFDFSLGTVIFGMYAIDRSKKILAQNFTL